MQRGLPSGRAIQPNSGTDADLLRQQALLACLPATHC